jgi:hypothetical protein
MPPIGLARRPAVRSSGLAARAGLMLRVALALWPRGRSHLSGRLWLERAATTRHTYVYSITHAGTRRLH